MTAHRHLAQEVSAAYLTEQAKRQADAGRKAEQAAAEQARQRRAQAHQRAVELTKGKKR